MSHDAKLVLDVMHPGVVTCPPETPLPTVGRMMARYRIHAVVVTDLGEGEGDEEQPWRVVSDLDIATAIAKGVFDEATAGSSAAGELVTIGIDEPTREAARLMAEHEVAHLVVTNDGAPAGVVSTLDLAAFA